jgi:hypothetical protein
VQKFEANLSLANKLEKLGKDRNIYRIYSELVFIKEDHSLSLPVKGIIDTGAILSLFPMKYLDFYPSINTEDHTLWGIVDAPECHLQAKLASVNIKLIDRDGVESQALNIVAAFSLNDTIPVLIGMKDILSKFSSTLDPENLMFELDINIQ